LASELSHAIQLVPDAHKAHPVRHGSQLLLTGLWK